MTTGRGRRHILLNNLVHHLNRTLGSRLSTKGNQSFMCREQRVNRRRTNLKERPHLVRPGALRLNNVGLNVRRKLRLLVLVSTSRSKPITYRNSTVPP